MHWHNAGPVRRGMIVAWYFPFRCWKPATTTAEAKLDEGMGYDHL
jgi:hypothetical protein